MTHRLHRPRSLRPTRRDVLLGTMASGAALLSGGCASSPTTTTNTNTNTPPSQPPSTSTPTKPLGVALLGLGNYSETQLAPALRLTKNCELKGIVTGTPTKVE